MNDKRKLIAFHDICLHYLVTDKVGVLTDYFKYFNSFSKQPEFYMKYVKCQSFEHSYELSDEEVLVPGAIKLVFNHKLYSCGFYDILDVSDLDNINQYSVESHFNKESKLLCYELKQNNKLLYQFKMDVIDDVFTFIDFLHSENNMQADLRDVSIYTENYHTSIPNLYESIESMSQYKDIHLAIQLWYISKILNDTDVIIYIKKPISFIKI